MKFLREKLARRFFVFLVVLCAGELCFLGACGVIHIRKLQRALVDQELAAASYLLEQQVPPALVASAWKNTRVTQEGARLLQSMGHERQSISYGILLMEQAGGGLLLPLLSGGIFFATGLLLGAGRFLQRREQAYEEAEGVVAQYAQGKFGEHLPGGKTGALYQLFGSVEQLALSLQAKNEAEHQTKEFLKDMIANISHQLKTPLAALHMYMEILTEEANREETVRNFSRKSLGSLERMQELIQSLLKMARLDTGTIVFERRMCRVSELVEEAVGELVERARRENKEILKIGDAGEHVFCDFGWTKEALGNLVKNALDHTSPGGIIGISWERSPAILRLCVEDNGDGIRPEDMHHIFKQFYRGRESGSRPGVGLGLSLAKAIVEGQGGLLSVESRPGEGSLFWISFLTEL
ncbi:MAG: HAMP domain-containing histidine kinase [Lachnospiraceae bacterium]|nr:HAMP domain-containing histidine kinase [Lachnospiraceae bacterium]